MSKDNVLDDFELFVILEDQGLDVVKGGVVLDFVSFYCQDDAKLATVFLYPDQVPSTRFWFYARDFQILLPLVLIWGVVWGRRVVEGGREI